MSVEHYGVNLIAIIPQTVVLVMSMFAVYAMHIGNYHPASRVWQGIGGAVYILGYAFYVAFTSQTMDEVGRGIMWVGVTLNLLPRFFTNSGDFKWMVRRCGLKRTLMGILKN